MRFYWMLMNMCLPKSDIYQGNIAPNCLKNHINSWYPNFFQKKFCLMSGLTFPLSDVKSFLPDNLSWLLKKYIFRLVKQSHHTSKKFSSNLRSLITCKISNETIKKRKKWKKKKELSKSEEISTVIFIIFWDLKRFWD